MGTQSTTTFAAHHQFVQKKGCPPWGMGHGPMCSVVRPSVASPVRTALSRVTVYPGAPIPTERTSLIAAKNQSVAQMARSSVVGLSSETLLKT